MEAKWKEDIIPGLRHTVWNQKYIRPEYPKIQKDEYADVVIVGAGMFGLSVAYNLVKEGLKVIILEAKVRGSGMTGRTSAQIMAWNDDFYSNILEQHGEVVCKLVGDSHRAAIEFIEHTIHEEGIKCKFSKVNGYLFPHEESPNILELLYKEFKASQIAGFDVQMVDLNKEPRCGKISKAICFPNNGDFDPLMYINGLARAIIKRGGKIYEQSRVSQTKIHQVITEDGVKVIGEAIVLATNSPITNDVVVHGRQAAHRTYVIGFKVNKGSIRKAQWWDTDSPYHYVRLEEKDDYDVLLVGGNDHPSGVKVERNFDPYGSLEKWTRNRWDFVDEVLYKWSGQVYEPIDSFHLIGQDPTTDNVYICTGDSGQGMTGGAIAGMLIKDCILKRENPWMRAYNPSRLPPLDISTIETTSEIVHHSIQGYAHNVPLLGIDSIDIEDMPCNCGAIKQEGVQKVAIYKDEGGHIHKYSAVCPHMKCIIQWNTIDHTWDCPCHGSIFDSFGRCLNGPAKADLSPIYP